MKKLILLLSLISCNESTALKSEPKVQLECKMTECKMIEINQVEDKMFQPPNYSIRIELNENLKNYNFSAIETEGKFVFEQRSHLDEIRYFSETNDLFIKLKDHDDIEANKEFKESFKIYFKKDNNIIVVNLSLNYNLMLHEHNPERVFDKDFHWMGQDRAGSLELTTDADISDDKIEIGYSVRANLTGELEDIDLLNLEVENSGEFDQCLIEVSEEEIKQTWISCEGLHDWDFDSAAGSAGNAPMKYVDIIDNEGKKKTVMIMIHFLDPR